MGEFLHKIDSLSTKTWCKTFEKVIGTNPTGFSFASYFELCTMDFLATGWKFDSISRNLLKFAHRPSLNFLSYLNLFLPTTSSNTKDIKMWWNPFQVLGIEDISICVGYSHAQGSRCRKHLTYAQIEAAGNLLDHLSRPTVSLNTVTYRQLEDLSHYLLCPQLHKPQAESLIETWRRRILRFHKVQLLQKIQRLRSTVDVITATLEETSLTVPLPISLHDSSRRRVLDENRPIRSQGHNVPDAHDRSAFSSSSSRRRYTMVPLPDVYLGYDPNILSYYDDHSRIHNGGSASNGHSTPPLSAPVKPIQSANDQSQPHKEVQTGYPI